MDVVTLVTYYQGSTGQVEVITHSDSHCHWAVRAKL